MAKSRMLPCVLYFFNEEHERKLIIMLHIVFLLALYLLFFLVVHCIMVLLHSLIYRASGLSAVECLVYATLKAHYIFPLIIILLSSLSVAQVNVPGVCFLATLRRHTNYLFSDIIIAEYLSIAMSCDHYRNTRLDLVFVLQFTVRQNLLLMFLDPGFHHC